MSKKTSPKYSLQIPDELYSSINTSEVQTIAGKRQLSTALIHNQNTTALSVLPSPEILMGKKISTRFKNIDLPLHYRLLPGPVLKIGPIVGVLVARKTNKEYPLPTGWEAKIYKEMCLEAGQKNIFLYFFYADGVDWIHKTINGHIYVQTTANKSGWVRGSFPLPDIIYNRIAYRSLEKQKKIQTLINKAGEMSVSLFNTRFLDKWEVHRTLNLDPHTCKLLPEAYLYSEENLIICLEKYETVFIKPVAGSVGKGIIQVKRLPSAGFSYNKLGNKKGDQQTSTALELYKALGITDEKKFMIQKGIDLAKVDGNIFDLRVQVQKNGYGVWTYTGVGVRIAAPGKFVTHVPNGGSKAQYETVIKEVFGDSSEMMNKLNRQLKNICQTVPQVLEHGLGLSLAVLSMDIGIDVNGQMWVIEVNSKPASFDEDDIRSRHLSLLTDYLLYRSNFVVSSFCEV